MIEENPELSPDLEWMLLGTQVSPDLILETLVREYYPALLRLAKAILNDPDLSQRAVQKSLLNTMQNRQRYIGGIGVKIFVYGQAVKVCHSFSRSNKKLSQFRVTTLPASKEIQPDQTKIDEISDADIWREVDRLEDKRRISLVLRIVGQLSTNEIGAVMQLKTTQATNLLDNTYGRLYQAIQPTDMTRKEFEEVINASFTRRWPGLDMDESELQSSIDSIHQQYRRYKKRDKTTAFLRQSGLVGCTVAMIVLTVWVTGRLASKELPSPVNPQIVIITQIVHVPIYITPTACLSRIACPLSFGSDLEEVRQRIISSSSRWKTLWWEAIVYQYGPPGYVGPPVVRREQVWVSRPMDSLVISGPINGYADQTVLSLQNEQHILGGSNNFHSINITDRWFPKDRVDPYQINSTLIFQPQAWAIVGKEMQISGSATINGRETLIVDMISAGGQIQQRIWVEVDTGTALGLRFYAEDGTTVTGEIFLSKISYDVEFPELLFDPDNPVSEFVEDYTATKPAEIWEYTGPFSILSGHEPLPRIHPPAGFDPSNKDLRLKWYLAPREQSTSIEMTPVDVFSGEYYLGQAMVGNPWSANCERSPDGRYLAIVEQPDTPPFPPNRLMWLDITGELSSHEPLPAGSSYGNDFAFSPDSRLLAFWGCGVKETNCGVYILDLQTRKLRKILAGSYVYYFAWRPDGEELMLLRVENQVLVVRPDTGEITYKGDMDSIDIPKGAPMNEWNITISPYQTGMPNCSFPDRQ